MSQKYKLSWLGPVDWQTFPLPLSLLDCLLLLLIAKDELLLANLNFCCCHHHPNYYRLPPDVSPCSLKLSPVDVRILILTEFQIRNDFEFLNFIFEHILFVRIRLYLIWCPIALRRFIRFDVRFGCWNIAGFVVIVITSVPGSARSFFFRVNKCSSVFCTQFLMRYYRESSTGNRVWVFMYQKRISILHSSVHFYWLLATHCFCFFCSTKTLMLMTEMRSAFMCCWENSAKFYGILSSKVQQFEQKKSDFMENGWVNLKFKLKSE